MIRRNASATFKPKIGLLVSPRGQSRHQTARWGRCKRVNSETSFMYQPSETELRARLTGFIEKQTDGPVPVGELTRYSVGFSWLTYGFEATWEDGGKRAPPNLLAPLRPPPPASAPPIAAPP